MVGPILLEEAKPLPADLNVFLDKAMSTGRGAVYVSMGTLVVLSADEARSMAAALSALDSFVLWKLDSAHLPGLLFVFQRAIAELDAVAAQSQKSSMYQRLPS